MDNNLGEQSLRGPVVGRKSYYGSGSIWSANLTAMLFTIFATLVLWDINSRTWLSTYLIACVKNGGKAPKDINSFLPWKMNQEEIKHMKVPV
jgi:transposase